MARFPAHLLEGFETAGLAVDTTQHRDQGTNTCRPATPAGGPWQQNAALMSQLASVRQLATAWLDGPPPEAQYGMRGEEPLTQVEVLPFEDQVWSPHNRAEHGGKLCTSSFHMQPVWT